jgi:hypothetical protein
MADAYGTLIFSCSEDVQLKDKKKLVKELNNFSWDNWGGNWVIDKDRIYYGGGTVQYPSVFPSRTKSVILMIDGVKKVVHPSELTKEDEDYFYDKEDENVPLDYLRDLLAKYISKGWIEIACIANEKSRYIYLEELRIYSDGRAFRKKSFIGSGNYYPNYREEEHLTSNSTGK